MVRLATFIAARQCGRIIVDEQGYHYKKTSVNKKTCVSKKDMDKNSTELKTFEWDILNPDLLINLEINNKRRTSII